MSHYTIAFIRYLMNLIHPHGNVYVHVSGGHTASLCLHQVLNELPPSRWFFIFMIEVNITPPSASLSWVTIPLLSLPLMSLWSNASTHIHPNLCLRGTPMTLFLPARASILLTTFIESTWLLVVSCQDPSPSPVHWHMTIPDSITWQIIFVNSYSQSRCRLFFVRVLGITLVAF